MLCSYHAKRICRELCETGEIFFLKKNFCRVPGGMDGMLSATKRTPCGRPGTHGRFREIFILYCRGRADHSPGEERRGSAPPGPKKAEKTRFFRFLRAVWALATWPVSPLKKRAGEGMGAWGEGLQERLAFGKAGPSRAGSDRMAAAGRARCDEGMGIGSRDEGFPFPPKNNLRIVLTGPG